MIIFKGNDKYVYRDPACFFNNETYYLFFTVSEKDGGYMYNRVAMSESTDLKNWTEPKIITERNFNTNYCSPGNVIEHDGEYILCFTSYPMPFTYNERHWADETARLFIMRTKDFKTFTEPELLNPKSGVDEKDIGIMIDPFIIKKDNYYYIFFKQNCVSFSRSADFKNWEFLGNTQGGENACVIKQGEDYIFIHSPENDISFLRSKDLKSWEEFGFTTLGQHEWEWANGRITAGFVLEAPAEQKYKYMLFFHGSADVYPETHGNATLAVAFTDDFITFYYEL